MRDVRSPNGVRWRAMYSEGGYVAWTVDEFGRLLAMWGAQRPEDFEQQGARTVARFVTL